MTGYFHKRNRSGVCTGPDRFLFVWYKLFVQFQRKAVRVEEEGHFLSGKIIDAYRLRLDSFCAQPRNSLFHIFNCKGQMAESAGFRAVYTGRLVLYSEYLQLTVTQPQVQLPVIPLSPVIFADRCV